MPIGGPVVNDLNRGIQVLGGAIQAILTVELKMPAQALHKEGKPLAKESMLS
jgi:hypothetical protein